MKPEEHIKFFTEEELEAEIWKDVPNYEGYYQVSNLGRVKSLERIVLAPHNNMRVVPLKILSLKKDKDNYFKIVLSKDNLQQLIAIHRLVLMTFVRDKNENEQCRHLDGDNQNNRVENLKWGTAKENSLDRIKHGTQVRGDKVKTSKITWKDVVALRNKFNSTSISVNKLQYETRLSKTELYRILKNEQFYDFNYTLSRKIVSNEKLNKEIAKEIRYLYNYKKETIKELANRFSCGNTSIVNVINNYSFVDSNYIRTRFFFKEKRKCLSR